MITDLLYHRAEYAEDGLCSSSMFSSVTLLNRKLCGNDFAVKAFEDGKAFDTVR